MIRRGKSNGRYGQSSWMLYGVAVPYIGRSTAAECFDLAFSVTGARIHLQMLCYAHVRIHTKLRLLLSSAKPQLALPDEARWEALIMYNSKVMKDKHTVIGKRARLHLDFQMCSRESEINAETDRDLP